MLRANLNRREGGYGGSRTRATQCRPERFTKAGLGFSLESVWNEDLDVFRNKDRSLRLSVLTLRSHVTNTCCVPDLLSRLRIQCFCPTIFIEFLPRAKSCTIRTLFREDFLLGGVPTCRGAETESPPPHVAHPLTSPWGVGPKQETGIGAVSVNTLPLHRDFAGFSRTPVSCPRVPSPPPRHS